MEMSLDNNRFEETSRRRLHLDDVLRSRVVSLAHLLRRQRGTSGKRANQLRLRLSLTHETIETFRLLDKVDIGTLAVLHLSTSDSGVGVGVSDTLVHGTLKQTLSHSEEHSRVNVLSSMSKRGASVYGVHGHNTSAVTSENSSLGIFAFGADRPSLCDNTENATAISGRIRNLSLNRDSRVRRDRCRRVERRSEVRVVANVSDLLLENVLSLRVIETELTGNVDAQFHTAGNERPIELRDCQHQHWLCRQYKR
jgi:hypothetical protein